MFFSFSYFCDGCAGLKTTGSRRQHICAFLVRVTGLFFSLLLFQWIVFKSIFMGRISVLDRMVQSGEQYKVSRMIFLKNPCCCGHIPEPLCQSPSLVSPFISHCIIYESSGTNIPAVCSSERKGGVEWLKAVCSCCFGPLPPKPLGNEHGHSSAQEELARAAASARIKTFHCRSLLK